MFKGLIENLKKGSLLVATAGAALTLSAGVAFAQNTPVAPTNANLTTATGTATTNTTATPTPAPTNTNNSTVALTAVPPRFGDDYSLVLQPGQTTQVVLEVRNPTSTPIAIQSIAKDFIIGDDGETPLPVDDVNVSNRWSLANWLTITPNNTVIEARKTANVLVTIQVPNDALPGGHYAMILHKPATSNASNGSSGASVSTQVGTLLYVVVDGDITENAAISDFSFKKFSEFGPVDYNFTFNNESSMHVRPEISIVIKNLFGQVTDKLTVDQKNVFPGAPREYLGRWEKVWGFGPYKAELTAVYGRTDQQVATAIASFWILPIRLIIAVLIVILVITLIIVGIKRKYANMLQVESNKVKKLDEKLKKAMK
jgi:hypothetical protein